MVLSTYSVVPNTRYTKIFTSKTMLPRSNHLRSRSWLSRPENPGTQPRATPLHPQGPRRFIQLPRCRMESRTYLEGSGNTDEVQVLLFHSFSCGDKSRVGGFSLSSPYFPCTHICSNPTEKVQPLPPLKCPFHSMSPPLLKSW